MFDVLPAVLRMIAAKCNCEDWKSKVRKNYVHYMYPVMRWLTSFDGPRSQKRPC